MQSVIQQYKCMTSPLQRETERDTKQKGYGINWVDCIVWWALN